MGELVKAIAICEKPKKSVFAGEGKYLRLQKFSFDEITHPVCEEDSYFMLVKSGSGTFVINGVSFSVSEGVFCWLQSYHVLTIEPAWRETLEVWTCMYDYQLSSYLTFHEQTPETVDAVLSASPIIMPEKKVLNKVVGLFDEFDEVNSRTDSASSLIKVAILGQLSVAFVREGVKKSKSEGKISRPLGWNASMYISAHCTEPIKIEDVTAHFKTDAATLNHELRIVCGQNFNQMLNRARVNMAATAILFDGLSFSFIALYSGFRSEIAFYRSFKKQKGITPQEYRERTLNDGEGIYRGMIINETLMGALNYMYENFSEQVSLETMAQKLYTSESNIRSLLKDKLNAGYKDILAMYRVRYAEALLATTNLPILDVSVAAGFNSDRTFTRMFCNMNSQTPSEFRQSCRNGEK